MVTLGLDESKVHENVPLSFSLKENLNTIKDVFKDAYDLVLHELNFGHHKACLVYLLDLVHRPMVIKIEESLMVHKEDLVKITSEESLTSYFINNIPLRNKEELKHMTSVSNQLLKGNSVLLVDAMNTAFSCKTAKDEGRLISESNIERSVKGPHEAFVEDIHTNLRLIRRKLRTPFLKIDSVTLGKQTNTQVSIVYIKGIANDDIVKEVIHRVSNISIDGVLDSKYIESLISDHPKSPLPTSYQTDRPDSVCGKLLEGKVAIIVDGTPYVITIPAVFVEFLHTSEDHYESSLIMTATRWIRFLGLFVTLILPAFYVAMTTFHQDLIQTPFLIRIAENREGLPYPVLVEAIFMYITFELIREAALRMPKVFGGGIVAILGLVLIGQEAIEANILGPVLTIVVSATALISFILPNYSFHQVIRYSGIPLLILAGLFGFMGIIVGLMFGLTHIVSMRSFGVPYFSPVSPAIKEGWKDVFIRAPRWGMNTRPPGFGISNINRTNFHNQQELPHVNKENNDD